MKRRGAIFLAAMFIVLSLSAQEYDWHWAQQAGGSSNDKGQSIAVDTEGNIYVTGDFYGTTTFGSTTLTSSGRTDIFIAKMDKTGNWLWAKQAGGAGHDYGQGVAVDTKGNSYVTGRFSEAAIFGNTILTNNGESDAFIAKLDTDGNWLWVTKAGGAGIDSGYDIAVDAEGNCHVSGYFSETVTFGSTTLTSSGSADVFVAKLDTDGNWLWMTKAGGSDGDFCNGIAVDTEGNSYVTGIFNGTALFGKTTLINTGYRKCYVAKLDRNGNWLWAKKPDESYSNRANDIAVDIYGNCFVIGNFSETATFGSTTLTSSGGEDIFVVKMDSNGNWLWAEKAGGTSNDDIGRSIAVDANGNSFITGGFSQNATFGGTTLASNEYYKRDIFVAKLAPNGNWIWAKRAGGAPDDEGQGIAVDAIGNSYVTGYFENAVTFGATTLRSRGSEDIFVAKLTDAIQLFSPNGGEEWVSGSTHTVHWRPYSKYNVNIKISVDNGENWTDLNSDPVSSLSGEFSFIVPDILSDQCLIKVESTDGRFFASSKDCFSIVSSVNSSLSLNPISRGKLQAGREYSLSWESTGIKNIKIEYFYDSAWHTIATSVPAKNENYKWTVPNIPADKCYLRISDVDNQKQYSISSAFKVCTLEFQVPEGGEVFDVKYKYDISWSAQYTYDYLKLEYTADDGENWWLIDNWIPALTRPYSCKLPLVNSDQCRFRLTDNNDSSIHTISDRFTLVYEQEIFLESPKGGETVLVGNILPIRWSSTEKVKSVRLYYSTNGGTIWRDVRIDPVRASLGKYDLKVPNRISDNCFVKVVDADHDGFYDISKAPFSIVDKPVDPTAAFTADVKYGLQPLKVQFTDESHPGTDIIQSWSWEFGDGQTSDEQNPIHIYDEIGLYTIKLTVTNTLDVSHSITKEDYVEVYSVGIDEELHLPLRTDLHCNYPNPFNPETQLQFSLVEPGLVKIEIYNLKGQRVKTLVDNYYAQGHHTLVWNGSDDSGKQVSSGIYFYRMETDNFIKTRRMSLIK